MSKELNDILDGHSPRKLDGGVVYRRVKQNIESLSKDALAEAMKYVGPIARLKLMDKRCESGDAVACDMYDIAVEGDPSADPASPKRLGIRGQCQTGNQVSCDTLDELGERETLDGM